MAGQKEQSRGDTLDVEQAVGEIREEARRVTDEVKEEVEDRADRWSSTLGRRGDSLARALHAASDTLRDEGEGGLADLAHRAAEQVHRMGQYLEDEDPSGMLDDLEETGRSNPAAFMGAAFAAGVLGGRLLRASAPDGDTTNGPGRERDLEDRPGVGHPPASPSTGRSAATRGPGGETAAGPATAGEGGSGTSRPSGDRAPADGSSRRGQSGTVSSEQSPRGG